MQSPVKAGPKAVGSNAMLFLSIFVASVAPVAGLNVDIRQHRQHPDAPNGVSIGEVYQTQAEDIAWKTGGMATRSRAGVSRLRSQINEMHTEKHAEQATIAGNQGVNVFLPQAKQSEAAAQAALTQTLAREKQVNATLAQVDAEAYAAAQKAAVAEVAKLEGESKAYFHSLLAKFKALAAPGPPTAADAAAKAAQPYIDVELRVGALVQYYNEKAITDIATATQQTFTAQSIATTAQAEQAAGIVDMAQRHMIQAHMLVGAANLKKAEAYKVRKLAESLNMSIPSYQRAAQMAAVHALATFAGLQVEDKAHVEMRRKVKETTEQVAKGFAELEAAMEKTMKVLENLESSAMKN